jgi:ABC-type nitrate/sulfonate/bicarbonate transport system permease component
MNQVTKTTRRWEILPVAIFLVIWEAVARLNLIPGQFFFPPFSVVMHEFYRLISNGVLLDNFLSSLIRVLIGFFTGSVGGIVVGIMMG